MGKTAAKELMRMWASSTQVQNSPIAIQLRGFSLLEMLMVLFIIGLSASLVGPNLPTLFDRISFAMERDTFIRVLNTLPYRAYDANQDYVLVGKLQGNQTNAESEETNSVYDLDKQDFVVPYRTASEQRINLTIPDSWIVSIPDPIFYRSSGYCTGGSITVLAERLTYSFVLKSPYCQISESDG